MGHKNKILTRSKGVQIVKFCIFGRLQIVKQDKRPKYSGPATYCSQHITVSNNLLGAVVIIWELDLQLPL